MKPTMKMFAKTVPVAALFAATALIAGCSSNNDTTSNTSKQTESAEETTSVTELTPEAGQEALESTDNLLILDVRRPDEFAAGHIEGAININFESDDFAAQLGDLDLTQPTFLYCRSGNRSSQALAVMKDMGFAKVLHLSDGILGWEAAGLPLVTE